MIVSFGQVEGIRRKHPEARIVFAGGTFDIINPGHVHLIEKMRTFGDLVVIAISTDKRVKQRKGPSRPIHNQKTRLAVIDAIKGVDYALIAPEPAKDQPVPTIQVMSSLRPDVFITCEPDWGKFKLLVNSLGTEYVRIPRLSRRVSTTHTIKKVLEAHR